MKILVKQFPGRVWGEIGTPKGFLGIMGIITLAKYLGKPRGGPIPPQSYVFEAPIFWPPKGPGPFLGQDVGSGLQKWGPGSKISKLGNQKPCRIHWSMPQTEPYVASYGPKPFWGRAPKIWGAAPSYWATPLPLGQVMKASRWPLGGMGPPSGMG